jgi:hypothetical protein
MKSVRLAVGVFLFMGLFASASLASTAMRTFVAEEGLDTNACTQASPCRTFAAALNQTLLGGEVVVLDSAGFGPCTINQSVTISAPSGVYAGVSVASNGSGVGPTSSDGIDITGGSSTLVTLRGLTIVGPGASVATGFGIGSLGAAVVHVEDCEIRGFNFDIFEQVALSGQMFVKNTVLKDAQSGFVANAPAANVLLTTVISMDHLTINNNSVNGIAIISQASGPGASSGDIKVAIRESTISGNGVGVNMNGVVGATRIDMERCLIANGGTGINVGAGATVSISNCLISHNSVAGFNNSGSLFTRGNNTFNGNGANVGSPMTVAGQ